MTRYRLMVMTVALLFCLGACGGDSPADPTSVPTETPAPTITPGGTSVGGLVAAMEAAWAGSTSMRTTSWEASGDVTATPPAGVPVTIEEVVLPNSRHMVQLVGGEVVDEQIVVDGKVFMKGALVPSAIAPALDTNTWIEVDASAAASSTRVSGLIGYLLTPLTSPIDAVSPETSAVEAVPAGLERIAGRECQVFTFSTGGELGYELAVDATGLPCRMVISAAGYVSVTIYEFNIAGLVIAAPTVATPPAG